MYLQTWSLSRPLSSLSFERLFLRSWLIFLNSSIFPFQPSPTRDIWVLYTCNTETFLEDRPTYEHQSDGVSLSWMDISDTWRNWEQITDTGAEKCYRVSPETRDCDQSPIKCYSWSYITAQYPDPSRVPPAQPTFQQISHNSVECVMSPAILV